MKSGIQKAMANRPNIIFIMSDDHASHAISCYSENPEPKRPVINQTPNIDRIANEGMRFDNCFCTNSICGPSRAVILTGKHSHHPLNQIRTFTHFNNKFPHVAKDLQRGGYQTAMIGKWHLGTGPDHCPTGFDYWKVLPGQGMYHDPVFFEMDENHPGGKKVREEGYVTDILTDETLRWLDARDKEKPFFVMLHHKAPHREWETDEKHMNMYKDEEIPLPYSFDDKYTTSKARANARMRIDRDFVPIDVDVIPPKDQPFMMRMPVPTEEELDDYELIPYNPLTDEEGEPVKFSSLEERKQFLYQRYMKKYLRVIASIDDNIGRILDYLEENELAKDTVVIYTSDQGFFLGDHGWYDKRFMYEESLRMPFVIKYPREIPAGSVSTELITNLDFAQTWLDWANLEPEKPMQGRSFREVCQGNPPKDWRNSMYYRYWLDRDSAHDTTAHYGIRTVGPNRKPMKLIYYYADGLDTPDSNQRLLLAPLDLEPSEHVREWELFDLEEDPFEMNNVYHDPKYAQIVEDLREELHELQAEALDEPYPGETN